MKTLPELHPDKYEFNRVVLNVQLQTSRIDGILVWLEKLREEFNAIVEFVNEVRLLEEEDNLEEESREIQNQLATQNQLTMAGSLNSLDTRLSAIEENCLSKGEYSALCLRLEARVTTIEHQLDSQPNLQEILDDLKVIKEVDTQLFSKSQGQFDALTGTVNINHSKVQELTGRIERLELNQIEMKRQLDAMKKWQEGWDIEEEQANECP